jgi:hypothetical protein
MPYYTNSIHNCRSIRVGAMEGNRSNLLCGYSDTDEKQSVYSPACAIQLERTVGTCAGCHGTGRALVNGYCDVCRSCGANERQCLNPKLITRRTENARNNSASSMWRFRRQR